MHIYIYMNIYTSIHTYIFSSFNHLFIYLCVWQFPFVHQPNDGVLTNAELSVTQHLRSTMNSPTTDIWLRPWSVYGRLGSDLEFAQHHKMSDFDRLAPTTRRLRADGLRPRRVFRNVGSSSCASRDGLAPTGGCVQLRFTVSTTLALKCGLRLGRTRAPL